MAGGLNGWLAELAAAGKGGLDDDGQPLVLRAPRATGFSLTIPLPADFTGAALRGQVRAYPDSDEDGDPLATFTCANLGYADGTTGFTATLTEEQMAALPAAPKRDGWRDFPIDFLITPSVGAEELLLGAVLRVVGRITEAS